MHHPWREFRALADWTLQSALLPLDFVGITDFDDKTVTLDRRLLQAERRCTIAHEIEHIRRGPVPTDPVLAAREEEQIDTAVARKLISLERLGEALAWSANMQEAAAELWVDLPTRRSPPQPPPPLRTPLPPPPIGDRPPWPRPLPRTSSSC